MLFLAPVGVVVSQMWPATTAGRHLHRVFPAERLGHTAASLTSIASHLNVSRLARWTHFVQSKRARTALLVTVNEL